MRPWTALAAIIALAAAVRLAGFQAVFTPGGVRFRPDGDPYYHTLRARHLVNTGEVLWRDPGMNWPVGADVIWPPLFDTAIAGTAWLLAPGGPSSEDVAAAAAILPFLLGLAAVVLVAALAGELVGPGTGLLAALAMAILPTHVYNTVVGRADQHAAEVVLLAAILLTFVRASRAEGACAVRRAAALGLVLTIAFWTWQGSALYLLLLAGFVAVRHVAGPPGDPALARAAGALALGAGTAAALLVATLLAFGRPGALAAGGIAGLTGLAPALCLATSAGASVLAWRARHPRDAPRRALDLAFAAAAGPAPFALLPAMRDGAGRGLRALAPDHPWYRSIQEFLPWFGAPGTSISDDVARTALVFGLLPLLALLAAPALLRRARTGGADGTGAALAAFSLVAFLALMLHASRFDLYSAPLLAITAALGAREAARRLGERFVWVASRGGVVAVTALLAASAWQVQALPVIRGYFGFPFGPVVEMSARLREDSPAGEPGGVLGPWPAGHHIRWFSGLPVLATPFGVEGGPGAMEDQARFFLSRDPSDAERMLASRAIRWVMLVDPSVEIELAQSLLPGSPRFVEVQRYRAGGVREYRLSPEGTSLVVARLFFLDGGACQGPSLDGFRLVDESDDGTGRAVLYEAVPGARLEVAGAEPGAPVVVSAQGMSPLGRSFRFLAESIAGPDGFARLRLPYATGANGRTRFEAYDLRSGARRVTATVSDEEVRAAGRVRARLR